MARTAVALLTIALGGASACSKHAAGSMHVVALLDVSASIVPDSLSLGAKAIEDLTGKLKRGDRISIVPIEGDSETEAQGKLLRFNVPIERQAYDQDLEVLKGSVHESLQKLRQSTLLHPGTRTDILGSLGLAQQEFMDDGPSVRRVLIVLSDFIEDDDAFNFRSNQALANTARARSLAALLSRDVDLRFAHTLVYLGMLRSRDSARLSPSRRQAIREFWTDYFAGFDTKPVITTDGPGLLDGFVTSARNPLAGK